MLRIRKFLKHSWFWFWLFIYKFRIFVTDGWDLIGVGKGDWVLNIGEKWKWAKRSFCFCVTVFESWFLFTIVLLLVPSSGRRPSGREERLGVIKTTSFWCEKKKKKKKLNSWVRRELTSSSDSPRLILIQSSSGPIHRTGPEPWPADPVRF